MICVEDNVREETCSISQLFTVPEEMRTRTDKIGVRAGSDIGGTDISCNIYSQAVHGPDRTLQNYHRQVRDPLGKYAGLMRTRLPCDLLCHAFMTSLATSVRARLRTDAEKT